MDPSVSYDFLFKVVLSGPSGSGKSSILQRYVNDTFSEAYISTIGVDFMVKTLNVNGGYVKLQIWDTAGQERYKAIVTAYYRGAHAIILVFDLS